MKRASLLVFGFCLSLLPLTVVAQSTNYQRQYATLYKEYAKNRENIGNLIAMSQFFADTANPQFNLPQAGTFIRRAESLYTDWVANDKHYNEIFKLMRKGVSLNYIRQLHASIDSTALVYVQQHSAQMTEAEMAAFVDAFRDNRHIFSAVGDLWNQAAFQRVSRENTVEAYYAFILDHPGTAEAYRAERALQTLAPEYYARFSSESDIKRAAKQFPQSEAMQHAAMLQQSKLAFAEAARLNTVGAYQAYLEQYPKGDNCVQALMRLEALSTNEFSTLTTPQEFADFAEQHSDFRLADTAIARLRSMIVDDHNATAARIYLDRFPLDPQYSHIYKLYYSWFSQEGNLAPIQRFIAENPQYPYRIALQTDLQRAQGVDSINLRAPFSEDNYATMATNIYKLTGKKIAFVALQRILQQQLDRKDWKGALARLQHFAICFEVEGANHYNALSDLVSTPSTVAVTPHNALTSQCSAAVVNPKTNRLYYTTATGTVTSAAPSTQAKNTSWKPNGSVRIENLPRNATPKVFNFYDQGRRILLGINGDIWSARVLSDTLWRLEQRLPDPVNTPHIETDAYILPDGSGMLLASDRPGGLNTQRSGDYFHGDTALATDLYFIPHTPLGWGIPVNLGIQVNTPYAERCPLLSRNMRTLYFISDGHPGLGYGDIFSVSRNDLDDWTHWSTPVNLGRNVNSPWDEQFLTFADNERTLVATKYTTSTNKFSTFSFPTTHDTSDVHRTLLIDCRQISSPLRSVFVADPVNQNILQAPVSDVQPGVLSVRICKGKQYLVLASADSLIIPSQLVTVAKESGVPAASSRPQTVTLSSVKPSKLVGNGLPVALNAVAFAPGTSRILPLSDNELSYIARILNVFPNISVEIVVNTDGSDAKTAYNLSLDRAYAIRTRLIEANIDVDRIIISPFGNVNYRKNNTSRSSIPEVAIRLLEK